MAPVAPLVPTVFDPLKQDIQKPYLELFRIFPTLEYSAAQIGAMRQYAALLGPHAEGCLVCTDESSLAASLKKQRILCAGSQRPRSAAGT